MIYMAVSGKYDDRHWWPPSWDDVALTIIVLAVIFLLAYWQARRKQT